MKSTGELSKLRLVTEAPITQSLRTISQDGLSKRLLHRDLNRRQIIEGKIIFPQMGKKTMEVFTEPPSNIHRLLKGVTFT